MQPPKIELRNIKHAAFASQETHCYTATLYVDGDKWGTVGNEGHGGCDYFHGSPGRDLAALDKRIAETMPAEEFEGMTLPRSLESVCVDLVNEWLMEKDYKRALRGGPMFVDPARPGLRVVKLKRNDPAFAARLARFREMHPSYKFLDDMPADEARRVYREQVAA